jgi:hypothetical protein
MISVSKETTPKISSKNRWRYRCLCRNRMKLTEPAIKIRPKSSAISILISNDLLGGQIGDANGND